MLLRLSRLVTTIIMLVLNTLATTLPLNGISTKDLSDTLSTVISPAGFTFSIWSVIYLGLIGLTIAVMTKKITLPDRVMIWYSISALANGLWIVARHYENLHLSMLIILALLVSLIIVDRTLLDKPSSIHHFARVRGIFLLYIGWVQIATLILTIIYAQYQLGWFRGQEILVGTIAIVLAGFSNLLIIKREKNIITSLVGIRALYGIISEQTDPNIVLTSQIVIWVLIAAILWHIGKYYIKK